MAGESFINTDELLTSFEVAVTGSTTEEFADLTPMEISLGESLHTPGLQTSVKFHSYIHNLPIKNFDDMKGADITIKANKESLSRFGIRPDFRTTQTIYRLDKRKLINNNTEEFYIRACDPTLLTNEETRVSKSWKCTTPSTIAAYVLRVCAGARTLDIEPSINARDYIAENIYPFQVVNQQANFALGTGLDPSFLHYMTYENGGTHHFRSLQSMTKRRPIIEYSYSETSSVTGFGIPTAVMTYNFPCDFDLLSDIMNGIDRNGNDINSIILFNPLMKSFSLLGNQVFGCGIGSGVIKQAISNMNSAQQQDMCPDYTSAFLLKRQGRMALIERDKMALRLVVPFNPELNVGKVIRFSLYNKDDPDGKTKNYGSGDYLIVNMVHTIKYGGHAVTTMDCVSKTVGRGIV
jgi:hypothetical protein